MARIDLPTPDTTPIPTAHRLADVIRARRDDILGRWETAVRIMPRADGLDRPTLIDHIPELLDRIAHMTEELGHGRVPALQKVVSERHAIARLEEGFDLLEVIAEFRVLRQCIFRVFADPQLGIVQVDELRVLNDAIDAAITDSVEQYTQVRERTLLGFDRVATAALESNSLEDLLRRLLQVLHDTTPAIDTSAVYLREGDAMRLRAAVGEEREGEVGLVIAIGEGFAGTIARRNEAMTLLRPRRDQLKSPALRRAAIRVLYGVPIADRGEMIGVATIGSLTADQFSLQDQRIFAAMVARATAAILQHVLRDQAERATQQLAERESQFRAVADNIPQLAWMGDATGAVTWYNRRWYEYAGTTFEEMQASGWAKLHHPDHAERVVKRWQRAVERGEPWEDTFPLLGADGHYRWFLSRAVPIRDAGGRIERWFGTNTDVTARRFLDDATRVLNRTLQVRETLEELARMAVPDLADWCVVDLLDQDQLAHVAIVHHNATKLEAAREFARNNPPDPRSGDGAWQVLRSGKPAMVAEITEDRLARTAHDDAHLRLLRELGPTSWIGAPLIARGAAIGVIHLIMSDSGRRYRESDLEIAVELGQRAGVAVDNARLYREARDAVRVRDDVLAIVSHDLRNPLGAIDLAATMLVQHHGGEPRSRKHLDVIRRSTDRMEHLINDLLDMASINAGKLAIHPTQLDASVLASEVLDIQESLAAERGITIMRECDIAGLILVADRNRLMQVFGNLLGNAIKFCAPGDVIMVRGERVADSVRFTVADTGPGIARGDLPHIFEPYWSGRSGKNKGTGLGLFITRAIVEAHGGRIDVGSKEGVGTTFTVTLPLAAR
jgi:PAS domain S-box-containing protein